MGIKNTGRYCGHCETKVMAQGKTANHVLHFLLTLFTVGLWLIVWVLVAAGTIGGWRCTKCGSRV